MIVIPDTVEYKINTMKNIIILVAIMLAACDTEIVCPRPSMVDVYWLSETELRVDALTRGRLYYQGEHITMLCKSRRSRNPDLYGHTFHIPVDQDPHIWFEWIDDCSTDPDWFNQSVHEFIKVPKRI